MKKSDMRVTDPVCGMTVTVEKAAARCEYGGSIYYFCADACRRQFEAQPDRYLGAESE